jgi:hypothetical protein
MPEMQKETVATYTIRNEAAPTLYKGILTSGRRFEIYFRHGGLRVSVFALSPEESANLTLAQRSIVPMMTILEREYGDIYSSCLEHDEIVRHTSAALIWEHAVEIPVAEYVEPFSLETA